MQGTINGKLYVRFEFSQRPFAYVSIFYAKKLTIYVLFVHLFRKCSIFPRRLQNVLFFLFLRKNVRFVRKLTS